jgi:hypothetical protein
LKKCGFSALFFKIPAIWMIPSNWILTYSSEYTQISFKNWYGVRIKVRISNEKCINTLSCLLSHQKIPSFSTSQSKSNKVPLA